MKNEKSTIRVNINTKLKNEAETILKRLNLDISTVINMTLEELIKRKALPFEEETLSEELLEALNETNEMINNPKKYPRYDNWDDLKEILLSND